MSEAIKGDPSFSQQLAQTQGPWSFWVNRGGTFTDIVAQTPDGSTRTHKLLSHNPEAYDDAIVAGMADLMGHPRTQKLPSHRIGSVKIGTTVATNALLERRGAKTVFVTTKGFADCLHIGTQSRPDIFALNIQKPAQLMAHVVEVEARILADGTQETPMNLEALRHGLQKARDAGCTSCAIALMHSYLDPTHEQDVAALAQDLGFAHVSVSHKVSPLIKLVGRASTTVVDAYVSPVLQSYVARILAAFDDSLPQPDIAFMTSAGGLTKASRFQGRDAILSGPAGGVVACVETAQQAGFSQIIGFDMGGTSTDVSHFGGQYERTVESVVDGIAIRAPMLRIETVAAGGGSILHAAQGRFTVGPDSAGATPGPKAYSRGGPLTITDANVMVGKLQAAHFPKLFGQTQSDSLDVQAVQDAFATLAAAQGGALSPEALADGFIQIAVENMAQAIKTISVQRGYDVSPYVLQCFGGAGGQHACLVAEALGIGTVFIHHLSGVLSAFGMGLAKIRALQQLTLDAPLDETGLALALNKVEMVAQSLRADLQAQGVANTQIRIDQQALVRVQGTDTPLQIALTTLDGMRLEFAQAHQQQFGFSAPSRPLILEALQIEAFEIGHTDTRPTSKLAPPDGTSRYTNSACKTQFFSKGTWHTAALFTDVDLSPNIWIKGPALLAVAHQTICVEPNWVAFVNEAHDITLFLQGHQTATQVGPALDPIRLEIFNNLFMSVATQMGHVLQNTASSVNIKERLDFSCAIFDAQANLVANAPHIPVHLGSMDKSVESVIRAHGGDIHPGDVFALNAPYNGGTHLPDITVVTPVFDRGERTILFYVAARGHHADIGGVTPGSMSPLATHIDEEGVYIDRFKLVDRGVFQEQAVADLLTGARYPVRNLAQNLADLRAQVAANARGQAELLRLVDTYGQDTVQAYMGHVQDHAAACVAEVIAKLEDCTFTHPMDQGCVIRVSITIDKKGKRAKVDFTGTSPQRADNFNAPRPVTQAAVLYVFRTLVAAPIPLNAGCLRPIEIVVPEGSMLAPTYPAAVVAGNVEVSQAVTDCLFGALGVLACAQGTMNNLTFGDGSVQYYETICSGAPAGVGLDGAGFHGADAVHTHMTNSRLTDPEILERRFPVVVEDFHIRPHSGGRGRWHGGNGISRTLRFRQPMDVALLSGHRRIAPFGLKGGGPGAVGQTHMRRLDGTLEAMPGCFQTQAAAGEAIVLQTPTGGGYGPTCADRTDLPDV